MARNPQFGWALAGASNLVGGFDSNVYTLERGTAIGPGTTQTFRSSQNPLDAVKQNNVQDGWNEYWKAKDTLDAALQTAGITSINSAAAAPLKELKAQFVADLQSRNKDWADAYNSGTDGSTALKFLAQAAEWVQQYPKLGERSDFRTLYEYMKARQIMQSALAKIGVSTIDSQTAQKAGLTDLWDQYTQGLVEADIGFSQMYTRARLDADNLKGSVY
jgi:hypothetical protein